jgi:type IV pilus assembly protein PilN
VVLCAAGACYFYGVTLTNELDTLERSKAKVEKTIAEKRAQLPGLDSIRKDNEKIKAQINTITGLKSDPVRYGNLLWELAEILPSNVYVASVNVDPAQQSLTLSGTAISYGSMKPLESIAKLMRSFQTARYFTGSTLSSTSQAGGETGSGYSFQIEAKYDANAALKSPDQVQPRGAAAPPAPAAGAAPSGPAAAPAGAAPAGAASPAPGAPSAAPSGAPSPDAKGAGKTSLRTQPEGGLVGMLR